MSTSGLWVAWVFLSIVGAMGAMLLVLSLQALVEQERLLRHASPVIATVQWVGLAEPRPFTRGGFSYRPVVRHAYRIGGTAYVSDRLYPQTPHLDARDGRAAIAVFKPGARVRTYVPASSPEQAFVVPKRHYGMWGAVFGGGMFLLPWLALCGWTLRRKMLRTSLPARGPEVPRLLEPPTTWGSPAQ